MAFTGSMKRRLKLGLKVRFDYIDKSYEGTILEIETQTLVDSHCLLELDNGDQVLIPIIKGVFMPVITFLSDSPKQKETSSNNKENAVESESEPDESEDEGEEEIFEEEIEEIEEKPTKKNKENISKKTLNDTDDAGLIKMARKLKLEERGIIKLKGIKRSELIMVLHDEMNKKKK